MAYPPWTPPTSGRWGDAGTILFFNGTSWSAQTSGTTESLYRRIRPGRHPCLGGGSKRHHPLLQRHLLGRPDQRHHQYLYGVSALDATHVWAVGEYGTILFFNGTSWSPQTSGTTANLVSVSALDATHVWAVGASGTILFFNGTFWSAQASGTTNNLMGVSALDATHVWAVGNARHHPVLRL